MKKKIFLLFLVLFLMIPSINNGYAQNIQVVIDGNYIQFDVPPQVINDRTMVPMRAIFEALGAKINWDNDTQTVTGIKGNITISLKIDNIVANVNGIDKTLDTPAVVVNGRTMVPVRFISEALGAFVRWDDSTNTVYITTNSSEAMQVPKQQENSKIVFYTPNGKSYHYSQDCRTLARSKTILSGILQDAITSGHSDPCDVCVK